LGEDRCKVVVLINQLTRYEDVWGSGGIVPRILTSALDGREWLASRPGGFTPGTHWIGGWVGPRAVLDAVASRKWSLPRSCR
jgi:hypothetical protein